MKVSELIENLKACPQDLEVLGYYDGAGRTIFDCAAILDIDSWNFQGKALVLGATKDMYNVKDEKFVFIPVDSTVSFSLPRPSAIGIAEYINGKYILTVPFDGWYRVKTKYGTTEKLLKKGERVLTIDGILIAEEE